MSQHPIIGTTVKNRKVHKVHLDPAALLMGHLLAVASSGGGKSWALRVMLEQTFGLFPHLVIDREGELKTLREKYDYIIFSADEEGDCRIDHRSGKLLARRMLELNASCIVDVFEFSNEQREIFVRDFCKALISAPRPLWGPRLVVIDEAHDYAPEKGQAESKQAVCELLAKGRKRGCGVLLASQRLAKLSKDAISECRTKLYGFCNLLADRKRATDDLGFIKKTDQELFRQLDAGEFYSVGPAVSKKEVILVKTAKVKTTHPRPGEGIQAHTPPPKTKLKKLMEELQDLPAEAKQEIVDLQQAKKEITRLRGELTRAKQDGGATEKEVKDAAKTGFQDGYATAQHDLEARLEPVVEALTLAQGVGPDLLNPNAEALASGVVDLVKGHQQKTFNNTKVLRDSAIAGLRSLGVQLSKDVKSGRWDATAPNLSNPPRKGAAFHARADKALDGVLKRAATAAGVRVPPGTRAVQKQAARAAVEASGELNAAQQRILDGLAWWEAVGVTRPDRRQAAFASGYTVNGHFNNTLGSLRTAGFVDYPDRGTIELTDAGRGAAKAPEHPPTTEELHMLIRDKLNAAQTKLFDAAVSHWPEETDRETLAAECGYTVNGHFNNTLGSLRSLGVLYYPRRGAVRMVDTLFLEHDE